MLVCVPVRVVA